jgi:uncharacterized membrane protein
MNLISNLKLQRIIVACALLFGVAVAPVDVYAQETDQSSTRLLEGTVTKVLESRSVEIMGESQLLQKLELMVTEGNEKGQTITVESGGVSSAQKREYEAGDEVQVLAGINQDGEVAYQISDYVRRGPLLVLALLFVGVTLLVSFKRGSMSLLAMGFSFLIIFLVILPLILAGWNPILVSLAAALLMIPMTFYLSHGFNRKTSVAVAGTLISLFITAILAHVFIQAAKLSGFSSDEAGMIQAASDTPINMQGLVLAGMILGLSGVLDDITISQSAIVRQLKEAQPKIGFKELFGRAMDVGKDHIASLVNTLVLVYTGAAMPLLLLFTQTERPFMEVINYEIVAEEVVRTLVVSIGIVLSVPLTTFLAAYFEQKRPSAAKTAEVGVGHHHPH